MRLRFSTSSLLSTIAFVAICLGGGSAFWRRLSVIDDLANLLEILEVIGVLSPILVPFVFLAYALGRRKLTPMLVLSFAAGEAAAVGTLYAIAGPNWPL